MKRSQRKGLSLPEIVGVIVMIGVLCAAVTPHFLQAHTASRISKLRFNLQKLRQQIDDFRTRHGRPPENLADALIQQDETIPENPFSVAPPEFRARVRQIDSDPPLPRDMTSSVRGGWLYNPKTGGIWPDHARHLFE